MDLATQLLRLYPGSRIVSLEPFGPDRAIGAAPTAKAAGYGAPIHATLRRASGEVVEVVFRVATANPLGHERRADRAAEQLQAYEDFAAIPRNVEPLDVGAIDAHGGLVSLRDCGELYLITRFARGTLYAEDLREVAAAGVATERDLERVDTLARYLAELHVPLDGPERYRRAIRDLVGSGEGIFGVVDSYPHDVPGAPRARLAAIEQHCTAWRTRMREHEGRLHRTHGDFHPFNILFDGRELHLLDASRGACGDPADDVAALSINYLLFAFGADGAWRGLGPLWRRFWAVYGELHRDPSLGSVIPPFFAWRALVVCNPVFYPNLDGRARSSLLDLVECALESRQLDPAWAEELFR
jgi:hypothetical protein